MFLIEQSFYRSDTLTECLSRHFKIILNQVLIFVQIIFFLFMFHHVDFSFPPLPSSHSKLSDETLVGCFHQTTHVIHVSVSS